MPTFLFLAAICLLVAASTLLETDAVGPSSSGNAEPNAGLIPQQNRWNLAACHEELTLIEPHRLIVQITGKKGGYRSVRAERAIPKGNSGIFYYEVTIKGIADGIYIGLATEQMSLGTHVGWDKGTYGYRNRGQFWGHEIEGCSLWGEQPYIEEKPVFKKNDVIGCGVDLAKGQIIYTKNGDHLGTDGLGVDSAADLFPSVSLYYPDNEIEANFGTKEFKFDIAKAFRK